MRSFPTLQRWLIGTFTAAVFACIVIVGAAWNSATENAATPKAKDSSGDAWVMYGGTPSRNMVNLRTANLPTKWTIDGDNVVWSADLGSKAYGGPVVVGGHVFVGTNNQKPREKTIDKAKAILAGFKDAKDLKADAKVTVDKAFDPKKKKVLPIDLGVMMSFAEKDGAFQWQHVYFKLPSGQVNDWPLEGICSSPVAEGDKMWYVNNRCEVVCSGLDGKIAWKFDMMKELGVFPHNLAACSPLLVGDKLWIVTANGVNEDHINVPAPKAPSFIAVDKNNGKVLWENNMPTQKLVDAGKAGKINENFFKSLVNRGDLIQHGQWSNAAYAKVDGQDQVVFPGGDGWIYSFDLKGKLLWRFDCNPKDAEYELGGKGKRNDFIGTPVIHDGKVYIGTGQDPEHEFGIAHLWCISMDKRGDVSPELVVNGNVWPPKTKPNPQSAKVWHFGGPADAAKVGRPYLFGRTMSTCAIKDDLLYIAEIQGQIHCLNAKTGEKYWTHDTKSQVWSSPFWADNKIYLGNDSGELYVFAHGKEKKLLATMDMERPIRATPVAANGRLFVLTENKLYAIASKK